MRIRLVNIGCKVNRVEIDGIAAALLDQGARLAEPGQADIVIMNTCTVTGDAEKKTRKSVRQALRENPHAHVLVTGCAVAIDAAELCGIDERVHAVGKAQAAQVAWELVGEHPHETVGDARADAHPAANGGTAPGTHLRMGGGFRTRVGIKVQDGCNNACTYCIVHVARGLPRSEPADQVAAEVRRYAAAGARELVLTGINLGTYESAGKDLAGLAASLAPLVPEGRIRISSVEPRDVTDRLIDLLADSDGHICRHLHLPLQSGSSRVLAQMARPYDAPFFLDLVARLRRAVPQISLSTDIIVGFPGETEEDFLRTLAVARIAGFSKIHVFRYSRRAGTPAAERSDQVDPQVIAERAHRLTDLGRILAHKDAARRAGSAERVLVERTGRGTTESYHTVLLPQGMSAGTLQEVTLTAPRADGIFQL